MSGFSEAGLSDGGSQSGPLVSTVTTIRPTIKPAGKKGLSQEDDGDMYETVDGQGMPKI